METAFEYLAAVQEAVRGTAITPPDHYLNMVGTITPMRELYRAPDVLGTLAQNKRSVVVRKWGELEAEGDLDVFTLPFLLNMVLKGGVTSPTTPSNGVLTRDFTFVRAMLTDNLKSATTYWGDPNQKIWQGAYTMADELTIENAPMGTDAARVGLKAHTRTPTQLGSPPAQPTVALGPLIVPGWIAVYADTTLAMGTTLLVGRVLSVKHTFPTGVTYKFPGQGPASGVTYHHTGRVKTACTTELELDMVDQNEYNLYEGASQVKLRCIHYGPAIETVTGPLTYYHMAQVDMWGTLDECKWGEYEGNRTLQLTLESEEDDTAGTDCTVLVRSTRTTV